MATEKHSAEATEQETSRPTPSVVWDDSRMKSTYANVCNVSSTREELTLLFGTNQTWNTGQGQVRVELSDRIILNPYAAKRLSLLLSNVLGEYEKVFGEIPIANQVPENN